MRKKAARRRLFYGGKYAVPRPHSDELLQFRCGLSPIDTLAQNTALAITQKSQPRLLTAPVKPRTIRQPLHHKDMPMRPLILTLALLAAAAFIVLVFVSNVPCSTGLNAFCHLKEVP